MWNLKQLRVVSVLPAVGLAICWLALGPAAPAVAQEPPPGVWRTEVVDPVRTMSVTLDFDFDGNPALGYAGLGGVATLANWTGAAWSVVPVGPTQSAVELAYDPRDGNPSLCYVPDRGKLSFAHWNGVSWRFQVVESKPVRAHTKPFVYDQSGNPSIVYRLDTKQGLGIQFARWNGSVWVIQTPDAKCYSTYQSLAYDGNGRPAIAYCDDTDGAVSPGPDVLKLARWSGSKWIIQIVKAGPRVGRWVSLAFDPISGAPAMVHEGSRDDLPGEYIYWDGTQWVAEPFGEPGQGINCSLAFDDNGTPMVAHGYSLKFAERVNGAWRTETVDLVGVWMSPGSRGISLKLKPDSDGRWTVPAIAYCDRANEVVKYAVREP